MRQTARKDDLLGHTQPLRQLPERSRVSAAGKTIFHVRTSGRLQPRQRLDHIPLPLKGHVHRRSRAQNKLAGMRADLFQPARQHGGICRRKLHVRNSGRDPARGIPALQKCIGHIHRIRCVAHTPAHTQPCVRRKYLSAQTVVRQAVPRAADGLGQKRLSDPAAKARRDRPGFRRHADDDRALGRDAARDDLQQMIPLPERFHADCT